MYSINHDVDRPDTELVRSFEEIPTTIISDVTKNIGATVSSDITPAYRGINMAGSAVTVDVSPGDNLIIHKAITMAEPRDVLVIDCDGYTGVGHIGELMCTSCQANNLAGLVIDGGYRDSREIREMEFPVYGRGTSPKGPLKQYPGSINTTISCGGASISPGDIIIGDDDGITAIPQKDASEILLRAEKKYRLESDTRDKISEGRYLFNINGYDELFEDLNANISEEAAQ